MTTVTVTQGVFNQVRGVYESTMLDDWSDLNNAPYQTWTNWTTWNSNPQTIILQLDDDLGTVDIRAPLLYLTVRGTQTVALKISTTGAFAGEETTISFTYDGSSQTYPQGRYYRWTLTVAADASGLPPEVVQVDTAYSQEYRTEYFDSLDTSTLAGTISSRTVATTLGGVSGVQITATNSTTWVDRYYALPDSFSVSTIAPVPGIVSRSPLAIYLQDHMGVAVNGVVDITITGTPKVYHTLQGVITI